MICILLLRSVFFLRFFSQICFFLRSFFFSDFFSYICFFFSQICFSQICRMLFELQQARGEDGGRVESLEVSLLGHLILFLIWYHFLFSVLCFVFCVLLSLSSFFKTTTQGFWFYHFHKQPQAKVVVTNLWWYYINNNNNNNKNLKVVVTRAQGDFQLGDQLRLIWTDQVIHLYMSKWREKS